MPGRIGRYLRAVLMAPHHIGETVRHARRIKGDIHAMADLMVRQATPAANLASELQIYRGYATADLEVFAPFQAPWPAPGTPGVPAVGTPGFVTDFLGVRTRCTVLHDGALAFAGQRLGLPVPGDFHAEAVEWIGVLKSVLAAADRFVALQLGAGWGAWLVVGATAAKRRGIQDIRLTGVEAEVGRVADMRQHFMDNGLAPGDHALIHGMVGVAAGTGAVPPPRPRALHAAALADAGPAEAETRVDAAMVPIHAAGDLLRREAAWDLVHLDLRSVDVDTCHAAAPLLRERARWVVVATRSRQQDADLIALLHAAGFALEHEKPARFIHAAEAGQLALMTSAPGIQVWRNPSFG